MIEPLNCYIAIALSYLVGVVTALIILNVKQIRHQKKLDRIFVPPFDLHNPINRQGLGEDEDAIVTPYGTLYRIRPPREV